MKLFSVCEPCCFNCNSLPTDLYLEIKDSGGYLPHDSTMLVGKVVKSIYASGYTGNQQTVRRWFFPQNLPIDSGISCEEKIGNVFYLECCSLNPGYALDSKMPGYDEFGTIDVNNLNNGNCPGLSYNQGYNTTHLNSRNPLEISGFISYPHPYYLPFSGNYLIHSTGIPNAMRCQYPDNTGQLYLYDDHLNYLTTFTYTDNDIFTAPQVNLLCSGTPRYGYGWYYDNGSGNQRIRPFDDAHSDKDLGLLYAGFYYSPGYYSTALYGMPGCYSYSAGFIPTPDCTGIIPSELTYAVNAHPHYQSLFYKPSYNVVEINNSANVGVVSNLPSGNKIPTTICSSGNSHIPKTLYATFYGFYPNNYVPIDMVLNYVGSQDTYLTAYGNNLYCFNNSCVACNAGYSCNQCLQCSGISCTYTNPSGSMCYGFRRSCDDTYDPFGQPNNNPNPPKNYSCVPTTDKINGYFGSGQWSMSDNWNGTCSNLPSGSPIHSYLSQSGNFYIALNLSNCSDGKVSVKMYLDGNAIEDYCACREASPSLPEINYCGVDTWHYDLCSFGNNFELYSNVTLTNISCEPVYITFHQSNIFGNQLSLVITE